MRKCRKGKKCRMTEEETYSRLCQKDKEYIKQLKPCEEQELEERKTWNSGGKRQGNSPDKKGSRSKCKVDNTQFLEQELINY